MSRRTLLKLGRSQLERSLMREPKILNELGNKMTFLTLGMT